jgi:putative endonuclease
MDPGGLGRRGEQVAAQYLADHGLVVVERNWRCREGEIDIVAREGPTLVFCEVKTRSGMGFGGPLAAVTRGKQARLRRLVGAYLAHAGGHCGPVRIDVVAILWQPGDRVSIEHLRGVG